VPIDTDKAVEAKRADTILRRVKDFITSMFSHVSHKGPIRTRFGLFSTSGKILRILWQDLRN
jgi:hypothetical protein